jgi:hypothetical protein
MKNVWRVVIGLMLSGAIAAAGWFAFVLLRGISVVTGWEAVAGAFCAAAWAAGGLASCWVIGNAIWPDE